MSRPDTGVERSGQRPRRAGATGRLSQVDNLRALLVAWIIGCHALLGYAAIGGWPYDEVNEVTMSPRTELVLSVILGPTALFVIGTFFFLAGLFAPVSMSRLGPAGFARSRLVRLGLPWLAFMLLVWPLFMWLAYRAAGQPLSFWAAFRGRQPFLDAGPLWFAQVLLYVSLGYALWTWLGFGGRVGPRLVCRRHVAALIAIMVIGSIVVRIWFPTRSQQVLDLHLWQWPQCVVMFCFGALVSGQGWADRVPTRISRFCAVLVLGTLIAAPAIAAGAGVADLNRDGGVFLGGWHWQAAALDLVEASLVVAGSVWLLALAQRHLTARTPWRSAWARGAYAAFLLQAPVLLSLAMLLRPAPLPALAKALTVGILGVGVSFWLGWLLVTRTKAGRLL